MTINDGYGDLQIEEDLAQWEAWLWRAALDTLPRTDPRFHDVLQEGRIEFWRTRTTDPEVSHALHRARLRMRGLAWKKPAQDEGRGSSGAPQYTGHHPLPGHIAARTTAILDAPAYDDGATTYADLLIGAADALAGVEMAYHRGEILQALRLLPDHHREYVVLRFWFGYTDTEIAAHQGLTSSKVLYNRWSRTIRPRLEQTLDHLVGAL